MKEVEGTRKEVLERDGSYTKLLLKFCQGLSIFLCIETAGTIIVWEYCWEYQGSAMHFRGDPVLYERGVRFGIRELTFSMTVIIIYHSSNIMYFSYLIATSCASRVL